VLVTLQTAARTAVADKLVTTNRLEWELSSIKSLLDNYKAVAATVHSNW
jgi:hypothetical protein